jgi:predicted dehydrogenase
VGLIGLSAQGGFASRAHVLALNALSNYELTGLTASTPQSSAAAASLYQVRAYDTPEKLASSDDVDLVVVAVRLPFHDELVRAALLAGKSVLCEWPLGRHGTEGAELAAKAEVAGVRTAICLQARSAPVVRYLADRRLRHRLGRGPPDDGCRPGCRECPTV